MPFSFHDEVVLTDAVDERPFGRQGTGPSRKTVRHTLPLILEKMVVPSVPAAIARPRLREFFGKSVRQFPANLISGRAGTGKTYSAVGLSRDYRTVAWYSVDPADSDWAVFSHYLASAVSVAAAGGTVEVAPLKAKPAQISQFLDKLLATIESRLNGQEMLIVLDDIHHVFDAPWFADFFNLLLFSVQPNTHLLLLCRSKPPLPLWRLRSKQVLNVIDEKLLAFDETEIGDLCQTLGAHRSLARDVPESAKGRIAKVVDFIRSAS